jgi:hypothetical protein
MMYERGAPLDLDHARLARLCGETPKRFKEIISVLFSEKKLINHDGGLWNKKVDVVVQERNKFRDKQRNAANARWEQENEQKQGTENASASVRHMPDGMPDSMPEGMPKPMPDGMPSSDKTACQNDALYNHNHNYKDNLQQQAVESFSSKTARPDDWPEAFALKILVDTINSPWLDPSKSGGLQMPGEIGQWRTNHCSWTEDVLPVVSAMAGKAKKAIGSWSYFTKAIYENRDTRLAKGPPIPQPKAPKHKPQDQAKLAILQDFRDWRGGDLRWPNGGKRPSRNDIFEALQAFGDEDDLAKFQLEFDVIDEAMSA